MLASSFDLFVSRELIVSAFDHILLSICLVVAYLFARDTGSTLWSCYPSLDCVSLWLFALSLSIFLRTTPAVHSDDLGSAWNPMSYRTYYTRTYIFCRQMPFVFTINLWPPYFVGFAQCTWYSVIALFTGTQLLVFVLLIWFLFPIQNPLYIPSFTIILYLTLSVFFIIIAHFHVEPV